MDIKIPVIFQNKEAINSDRHIKSDPVPVPQHEQTTIFVILTFGKGDGGLLRVDGVEDSLVADLRLTDETDLGAQVGDTFPGHSQPTFSIN